LVERVGPQLSLGPPGQNSGISNTAHHCRGRRWTAGERLPPRRERRAGSGTQPARAERASLVATRHNASGGHPDHRAGRQSPAPADARASAPPATPPTAAPCARRIRDGLHARPLATQGRSDPAPQTVVSRFYPRCLPAPHQHRGSAGAVINDERHARVAVRGGLGAATDEKFHARPRRMAHAPCGVSQTRRRVCRQTFLSCIPPPLPEAGVWVGPLSLLSCGCHGRVCSDSCLRATASSASGHPPFCPGPCLGSVSIS